MLRRSVVGLVVFVSSLLAFAGTAKAQVAKEFRFQNAEVVSVEPLLIRTGANPGLNLWIDGQDAGAYVAEEDVRIHVVGVPGAVRLHGVPNFTGDHGGATTEVFFEGAAEVWVGERDLVVRMPGVQEVGVEIGAAVLPVDEGTLNGATSLGWIYEPAPGTAKEFRIEGAEVVSAAPLVIRIGANTNVAMLIDGEERGFYLADQEVRLFVIAEIGTAMLPDLPALAWDYGESATEITFLGEAEAWVEDLELVVVVPGARDIGIESGAEVLPVNEATLDLSGFLTWACTDPTPVPHRP